MRAVDAHRKKPTPYQVASAKSRVAMALFLIAALASLAIVGGGILAYVQRDIAARAAK